MHYNMNTKNKSFINFHNYLKNKNIKNNQFMLTLNDKSLIGVDPFNPLLSSDLKRKIINECKNNIWFFFREILQLPSQGGGKEMFKLNKANCAVIYLSWLNINNWCCRSRATKATSDSLSILSYYNIFFDLPILLCDYKKSNADSNLYKYNAIIKLLPNYIYDFYKSNQKSVIHTKGLYNLNIDTAENIGRSFSYPLIHFDNAEFINNLKVILDSSKKVKEIINNKSFKSFYLYNSTINDNIDKNLLDFIDRLPLWKDKYYDLDSLMELLTDDNLFYIKTKYNELGFGEDYYTNQIACLNKDWNIN